MPKLFLTDGFVYSVKCPVGKDQIIYWDHPTTLDGKVRNGAQSGLGLRVTAQGAKAFVHAYDFQNRRRRSTLSAASKANVASARMQVQFRNQQIEDNIDPETGLEATVVQLTVRAGIDIYFKEHLSKQSPKYQREFGHLVAKWTLPPPHPSGKQRTPRPFKEFGVRFGDVPVESIKPLDVSGFINAITSDSRANLAYAYIKALFNWLIKMQLVDMRNPCGPLTKRKIIRRRPDYTPEIARAIAKHIFTPVLPTIPTHDHLTGDERRNAALAAGLKRQQQTQMLELCNFMGILFLTMARPAELRLAKFEHFDLERRVWHKHNTKGIKLSRATYEYAFRTVPVHPRVAAIVAQQRERWPEADYVFPSHTDPNEPRNNFYRGLKQFKGLEGVPDYFQIYDLKRMAISLVLVERGIAPEDLSHYVDHKGDVKTTMIYDLGFVEPLRPVANRLGQLLGIT